MALFRCGSAGINGDEIFGFEVPKGKYLNCSLGNSNIGTVQTIPANGQLGWTNYASGCYIIHNDGYTSLNVGPAIGGVGITSEGVATGIGSHSNSDTPTVNITDYEWLILGGFSTNARVNLS